MTARLGRGESWSVQTTDPDGNGVEIFCDTRSDDSGRRQWDGRTRMLSLAELRAAARGDVPV